MYKWLLLALLMGPFVRADEICGLFLTEDFSRQLVLSLTEFRGPTFHQVHYLFSEESSSLAQSMVNGQCYCVRGTTHIHPDFHGDHDFRILALEQILRGPFVGCTP